MAKKQATVLWMRVGNSDGYEPYDDLDDVADALYEEHVDTASMLQTNHGIINDQYQWADYISLYWGEDFCEPDKMRELTHKEFLYVKSQLVALQKED